ncbi:TPA: efflux RND transporter permease subunit, partial [Klebsiella pneumoniae]|nr:efflux RND transporter permease subunit [Klebsiella pneumoniae]
SFRAPMAIVVIGGLITSTFLSLLVIPVLYEVVDDLVQRCTTKRRQAPPEIRTPTGPPPQ